MNPIIGEMAPQFRKLTPQMLDDIKKYVITAQMDSSSIYPLLIHDYPGHTVNKRDLYNAVYKFRQQNNPGDADVSQMLQLLLQWKEDDPRWVVKPRIESISKRLTSIMWMSPLQLDLYLQYHDVIIMDTTSNTNRFHLMLCILIVVDSNYKSRIVATVLLEDETQESFCWIFDTLYQETGIYPKSVYTDSDPAMIGAIKNVFSQTRHFLCIFHIDLNLRKKLKGKLGKHFEEFRKEFYVCCNSLSQQLFEIRWSLLVKKYSIIESYLSGVLYNNKESWATAWISKCFTAGIQSTQRIESINNHIHNKVDRTTSLCDLLHGINDQINNEELFERFEAQRNAIPTVGLPMIYTQFFSQVDEMIKVYLNSIIFAKQRNQMNESLCYDVHLITQYQDIILRQDYYDNNERLDLGSRETEYDASQILFSSLIENVSAEQIIQVWHVKRTGCLGVGNYIVLLNDDTHLCTCMMLINKGIVCRHFFCVGTYSDLAVFHINLISSR